MSKRKSISSEDITGRLLCMADEYPIYLQRLEPEDDPSVRSFVFKYVATLKTLGTFEEHHYDLVEKFLSKHYYEWTVTKEMYVLRRICETN